jgi:hypothetical protein
MSRKKIILLLILIAIAVAAWYGYREYSRTNKDLKNVRPDFIVNASDLIKEFESGDSAAAKKYNGQILEVTGFVKNIDKDDQGYYTLVLGDTSGLSSVRCSMDTSHQSDAASLIAGSSAIVRGACTGFNKDDMGLGSDVILNRCAIIKK